MKPISELKINKSQIQKLASNLQALLNKRGLTEGELSKILDIPVMTVRRIITGETTDPRISTLKIIADYFDVPIDLLIAEENFARPAISPNHYTHQFVPILDWKTTANINSLDECDLTAWKDWQPITLSNQKLLSKNSFALPSKTTMQPRFPLGTLFIIDPAEQPNDGDLVLVKLNNTEELSIRELAIDAPHWILHPVIIGSESFFYDKKQHKVVGVIILTMLHTKKIAS